MGVERRDGVDGAVVLEINTRRCNSKEERVADLKESLEFAREVFATLQAFPPDVLAAWYGLYSTGEQRYFEQLTGAGS